MNRSSLRVYYGPEKVRASVAQPVEENTATVRLSEILPLLADAVNNHRTWLRDFNNDPVTITTDLYEVILAYQHCRRPAG
jgi:hypothetical protein